MPYVTDTHPLVWHLTKSKRFSRRAAAIYDTADLGREVIYIPTIVLGEIMYIAEAGQAPIKLATVLNRIKAGDNYIVIPLSLAVIETADAISARMEMHDRFILATAQHLSVPVITIDEAIVAAGIVTTVW